jgi:hypothetical protein
MFLTSISTRIGSTRMTSVRKFIYAGLLAISGLSFSPSPASAQEIARGRFTLAHNVHWQNAMVPAGEYRFSVEADGPSSVLMLSKLDGRRTGFLLVVHDTDEGAAGPSRLVLQSTPGGSYVSAMQLPDFGVTLHFTVPEARQIARAGTATQAVGQ